jgi:prophage tail gpP-like protein
MEEKLEEDKVSKKTSKKVFNVMVECLRNVYSDGINQELSEIESTAILLVKSEDDGYLVSTGNYIKNTEVELLKNRLDKINQMDGEKLKVYYQELLSSPVTEKGITSLGMIDIARKSKQKIAYQFQTVNEFFTFFTLEAKVVRK